MESTLLLDNYFAPLATKEGKDLLKKFKTFNYSFNENISSDMFFTEAYGCTSKDFNESISRLKYRTTLFKSFIEEMSPIFEKDDQLTDKDGDPVKLVAGIGVTKDVEEIERRKQAAIQAKKDAADAKKHGSTVDDAMSNDGHSQSEGGILTILKNLWNTLTEGGSAWGIVHLILDVIGLIGDAFTVVGLPIGVVADLLNAVLYFYRGKAMLGVISVIAAAIPFGGDILKGFKPVLKTLTKPFSKLMTKGAGKSITKEAAEILVKGDARLFKSGGRFFGYIKKIFGTAFAKVLKVIRYILDDVIGKVVKYIPGLGPYLQKFFKGMADKVNIVAENLMVIGKTFDTQIEKAMIKEADSTFKALNIAMSKKGQKILIKGDNVVIKEGGKILKVVPVQNFQKMVNVAKKYPSGPLAKSLKSSDDVAEFYVKLYNSGKVTEQTLKRLSRFGGSSGWKRIFGGVTFSSFTAFIAKQLIKIWGSSWDQLSDFEKKQFEDMTTTSELHEIMEKDREWEKEQKDAEYVVPYRDLFTEEPGQVAIELQKHQNYLAKKLGYPSIQTYFWSRAKAEKDEEMQKVYSDHAISDEEYDKILGISDSDASNSKQFESISKLKYIKHFREF